MEELVARVATAAGLATDQAERVVNLVFAFMRKEAPAQFEEMKEHLPEAETASAAGEADKPQGGGLMGNLMGKMSGGGGLMGLAAQLTTVGLGPGEMTAAGKEIFAFAREKAGEEKVDEIVAAIPGLGQLI